MAIRIAYVVEGPPPGEVCVLRRKRRKGAPRPPPMLGEAEGRCWIGIWLKVFDQVFASDIFSAN